jgi:hypothetical protein
MVAESECGRVCVERRVEGNLVQALYDEVTAGTTRTRTSVSAAIPATARSLCRAPNAPGKTRIIERERSASLDFDPIEGRPRGATNEARREPSHVEATGSQSTENSGDMDFGAAGTWMLGIAFVENEKAWASRHRCRQGDRPTTDRAPARCAATIRSKVLRVRFARRASIRPGFDRRRRTGFP